jgi:2-(1,2-epoxy-1,2-dihydrophenyl)acetyl-CoA isomerase
MVTEPHLDVRLEGGILTLTLNRPGSLNSLTADLVDDLRARIETCRDDDRVRCVVLTGAGRAFSSGQAQTAGPRKIPTQELMRDHYSPLVHALLEVDKPVVAAINGVAVGAAAALTLACDFRVMAQEARLAFLFVRIGLVPDAGSSWLLPRLIGQAAATELLLLGDDVAAADALALRLVNRVVPRADLEAATAELAHRLATAPAALGLIKRQLRASRTATLDEQLETEIENQCVAAETDDYREGVAAFLEKRPALFSGR